MYTWESACLWYCVLQVIYLPTIWDGVKITYHTVITFEGENFRKFVKNTIYAEETLADCSQEHHTPNFMEKTFTNSYKPTKFVKVFFLGSFPIYGIYEPEQ